MSQRNAAANRDLRFFNMEGKVLSWYAEQEKRMVESMAMIERMGLKKKNDKGKATGDMFEAIMHQHLEGHLPGSLKSVLNSKRVDKDGLFVPKEKDIVVVNRDVAPSFIRTAMKDAGGDTVEDAEDDTDEKLPDEERVSHLTVVNSKIAPSFTPGSTSAAAKVPSGADFMRFAKEVFNPPDPLHEFFLDEAVVARVELKATLNKNRVYDASKQVSDALGVGQDTVIGSGRFIGKPGQPLCGAAGFTIPEKVISMLRTTQHYSSLDFIVSVKEGFACFRKPGDKRFTVLPQAPGTALAFLNACIQDAAGHVARAPLSRQILVSIDTLRARALSEHSANVSAKRTYGFWQLSGEHGVEKDKAAGVERLKEAAEKGDAVAQSAYGAFLCSGEHGVSVDGKEGVRLLEKASKKGVAMAQRAFGVFLCRGKHVVEKDEEAGVEWLMAAVKQGDAVAQRIYASFLLDGKHGVEKDKAAGVERLKAAAENGDAPAQRVYGIWQLSDEHGVPQDKAAGVDRLKAAAEKGDAVAQRMYGSFLLDGKHGVQKDKAAGVEWLEAAAEKGDAVATQVLSELR